MSDGFQFEHRLAFSPELPRQAVEELLRSVPAAPGIFALRAERENAQPYLTRAADLRRRLRRMLLPNPDALAEEPTSPEPVSRRLNLRGLIRSIEWTLTGSDFESTLLLYHATRAEFGAERARERLKLRSPFVVRLTLNHAHPRLYVTNRLSQRSLPESFGPFPSRAAAERYAEAVGDLFKLRRCYEDLVVHPDHPGCAYGEMKLCLTPCKAAVTAAEYNDEARRAHEFLRTRGESLLHAIAQEREQASEAMDFELAASLHTRWEKVRAAASLADELVRPLAELRAVIVQEAAPPGSSASGSSENGVSENDASESGASANGISETLPERTTEAAVFLLEAGRLAGPERLSTLGVRAVREQTAVGSSLFAQPLMLSALPLQESPVPATQPEPPDEARAELTTLHLVTLSPEQRAARVLDRLQERTQPSPSLPREPPSPADMADALALFRRWYYRPEKQRSGEVFLPNADGSWPIRRLLNGAARVVLGPPAQMSPADREAAREATKALKTRVLHPGREGVERVVPVLPKRSRSRKSVLPSDVVV